MLFSYIVTRDFGFAPNPFPPYCTLATCKPVIRSHAKIDDWVLGVGSAAQNSTMNHRLIYAMQVQEILTYDEYWNDERFYYKRAVMHGSRRQNYGDNIYHSDQVSGQYIQENSHHSLQGGIRNVKNYDKDLHSKNVLISKNYWYFGKSAIEIPAEFLEITKVTQGHLKFDDDNLINRIVSWLNSLPFKGKVDVPYFFEKDFKRFKG